MDQQERAAFEQMTDPEMLLGAGFLLMADKAEADRKAKADEGSCFDEFEYRDRDYYTKGMESESE
jgi:hypothetical protein